MALGREVILPAPWPLSWLMSTWSACFSLGWGGCTGYTLLKKSLETKISLLRNCTGLDSRSIALYPSKPQTNHGSCKPGTDHTQAGGSIPLSSVNASMVEARVRQSLGNQASKVRQGVLPVRGWREDHRQSSERLRPNVRRGEGLSICTR